MFRLLGVILVALVLPAQLPDDTVRAIDGIAAKALADSGTPAVAVAVVRDGKLALAKAYGNARLEPKTAATAAMRFKIGSVSKQFLAASLLLAQEDGKLSLDDKVAKYLPELTRSGEITVRQLLSHTAGYQDYYPQDFLAPFMRVPVTPQGILDRWASKALDFEPGALWQYSNTGYVAAGRVLEKATGMPLMQVFRTRIFVPLGMKSVLDLDRTSLGEGDPVGYERYATGPLHPATPEAQGWLFAAGQLAMTVEDLARWDAALINGTLLRPGSMRQMMTPVILTNGAPQDYGLGVRVLNFRDHPKLNHGGAVAGFATSNTIWPDLKTAVAVVSNKDLSSAPLRITRELETLLLTPAADKDTPRLLEEAKAIFTQLQQGQIERERFTANGNAYFSKEALADYASSLQPLGKPRTFEQVRVGLRGGFTERSYRVGFQGKSLNLVVRADAAGKLEQFVIQE